ncbi:hypothetical protein KIMH_09700 [Bombiscardovia apis]|uniref:Uncharacterized protein n=1 Tax=Bombiscardovia apis TaxID=2932182 RepID=A0ABM8BD73_9BIFI|nr:hypothetical protein [Bombiscardovia apis]BDR54859.1 hypothetical protein KIMH_09700 [Bombiscardovia apis]
MDFRLTDNSEDLTYLSDYLMTAPEGMRLVVLESALTGLKPVESKAPAAVDEKPEIQPFWGILANVVANFNLAANVNWVANAWWGANLHYGANANYRVNANGYGNPGVEMSDRVQLPITFSEQYLNSDLHKLFESRGLSESRERAIVRSTLRKQALGKKGQFQEFQISFDIERVSEGLVLVDGVVNEEKSPESSTLQRIEQ